MSAEFPWEGWYHKEHDALCKVEARNYVLEKALREIAGSKLMPPSGEARPRYWEWEIGFEMLQDIAREALGEEKP